MLALPGIVVTTPGIGQDEGDNNMQMSAACPRCGQLWDVCECQDWSAFDGGFHEQFDAALGQEPPVMPSSEQATEQAETVMASDDWEPTAEQLAAVTEEDKARVSALFKQKFRARYPDHPWVKIWDERGE